MFRLGKPLPVRTPMECISIWTSEVVLQLGVNPTTIALLNAGFAELASKVPSLHRVVACETDRHGIKVTVYPSGRKPPVHLVVNPGPNYEPPQGAVS